MAWRNLLVQNPAKLSLKNAQLQLENDDGVFSVPTEDLICVVLESKHITVTAALLSQCQELGVCVVTCDDAHMPNGVLHPFHEHSRQSRVAHLQIGWNASLKKRLWQTIVRAKISGQADVLEKYSQKQKAKALRAMRQHVTSGDEKNVEAQAAREYWQSLLGSDFRRHGTCSKNAALNYGYAVMRAAVSRSLVSYGLLPAFGVHHNSELNAFNLSDDVLEIFRPFVDDSVKRLCEDNALDENSLSKENRQFMAGVLSQTCLLDGEVQTLINASDRVAEQLVSAIEQKNPKILSIPEIQKTFL